MVSMLDEDALASVAGPFKTFFERLAGDDGEQWWEAFKRFLRKENPWPRPKIWRPVTLGRYKTQQKLAEALGTRTGVYAASILSVMPISPKRVGVDLAVMSGLDLGITWEARRSDIYAKALGFGYRPCPAEVGAVLAMMHYGKKASEVDLTVAMQPITLPYAPQKSWIFRVLGNPSGVQLLGNYADPDVGWSPRTRWVFMVPRG